MKFAVFSHVPHFKENKKYLAYSPYVREMNVWSKYTDQLIISAPIKNKKNSIDISYSFENTELMELYALDFTSFQKTFRSISKLPINIYRIFSIMKNADHIHIRCPGNIGMLALLVQILFPAKKKTVKYAGNWDPKSVQPLSYRFQKWLLKKKFLTSGAKVLVYGNWNVKNPNVEPFFTSSFSEHEINFSHKSFSTPFRFLFVGTLSPGKRPELAIKIVEALKNHGYQVTLDIYGNGILKDELEHLIENNNLRNIVNIHGNQNNETIKTAYKNSHFSILPSKSEGWPKALAEAMFFGCLPIGTSISCIPWMLNHGERGIIIEPEVQAARIEIQRFMENSNLLSIMSKKAMTWSQKYTLESFEREIGKFI